MKKWRLFPHQMHQMCINLQMLVLIGCTSSPNLSNKFKRLQKETAAAMGNCFLKIKLDGFGPLLRFISSTEPVGFELCTT